MCPVWLFNKVESEVKSVEHEKQTLEVLSRVGAILTGHFVGASGLHLREYVNKDAVYPETDEVRGLCTTIAREFALDNIEVVVGPEKGAIILSQWTAAALSSAYGRSVMSVYAEKAEHSIFKVKKGEAKHGSIRDPEVPSGLVEFDLAQGDELIVRSGGFVIKRGYDKLVADKRVLVVEDILTTGGSVKKVIEAVRAIGGEVVGLAALCNRGKVTAEMVANPPRLFALASPELRSWREEECELCAQGIPINTNVGRGKEFLARQHESGNK